MSDGQNSHPFVLAHWAVRADCDNIGVGETNYTDTEIVSFVVFVCLSSVNRHHPHKNDTERERLQVCCVFVFIMKQCEVKNILETTFTTFKNNINMIWGDKIQIVLA